MESIERCNCLHLFVSSTEHRKCITWFMTVLWSHFGILGQNVICLFYPALKSDKRKRIRKKETVYSYRTLCRIEIKLESRTTFLNNKLRSEKESIFPYNYLLGLIHCFTNKYWNFVSPKYIPISDARNRGAKFDSNEQRLYPIVFLCGPEHNEIRRYIKNFRRGSNRGALSLLFIFETHL